jgi:hypothetical protein
MTDRSDVLLQLLHTQGAADRALAAAQVNGLATILGITERDLAELVGRLQDDGLIAVRWGGELRLTEKGSARALGKTDTQATISIRDIGPDANVNINSPHAVVGNGAMRIEMASPEIAARSIAALREAGQALAAPQQDKATALADSVEDAVSAAKQPQQDPEALKGKLARVKGLVGELSEIADQGGKLLPALAGIKTVLGPVARAIGIPWPF